MKLNKLKSISLFSLCLLILGCKTFDVEKNIDEETLKEAGIEPLYEGKKNVTLTEKIKENIDYEINDTRAFFEDDGVEILEEGRKENKEDEVTMLKEELAKTKELLEVYVKNNQYVYDVEPVIVPVTKYVVVDQNEFKRKEDEVQVVGVDAVRKSSDDSIVPLKDFTGGMSIFDYDENYQFPVFTRQLSMTTIILNDDEAMVDTTPFLSDTVNWEITGDIWTTDKGERQLIMIKPKESGLETNMLIVTNKRLYHFVLYSTKKDYQPMVKFRYPVEPKFITSKTKHIKPVDMETFWESVDMNMVSFNYRITVPFFSRNVIWKPEMVYDDGSHTYILLPQQALLKEIPGVWEGNFEITNYEFHPEIHNLIVINRLVDKLVLKSGNHKITITKKKGMPLGVKR